MSAREQASQIREEARAERLAALNLMEDALAARRQAERANTALRESEAQLALELADTRVLQQVSSSLLEEDNHDALYEKILQAARTLMRSDSASLQKLGPGQNELLLMAHLGFAPESAEHWQRVSTTEASSCGLAMLGQERIVVPNLEQWAYIAGTEELAAYRASGLRAMQSTRLVSRTGRLVGMISTHWRQPHDPPERELRLLDVLARQAADLIERHATEEALAEDLRGTRILQALAARLVTEENIQTIYEEILTAAIELTRAAAGAVQILDPETQELVLLAARGFSTRTVEHLRRIDASLNTSRGVALRSGDRSFLDFDAADVDVGIGLHVADGLLAAQSSPLVTRSGRPIGMVSTHWPDFGHRPSERELRFLDLLSRQAADLIEQRQSAAALRISEEQYRTLFESIDQGFCTIEMLFDDRGRAVDYRFLQTSPSFSRQSGMEHARGKTRRELAPGHEEHWFEKYGQVAKTGVPVRFEDEARELGRFFEVFAFPVGDPALHRVGVLFSDITDRRRVETALRESEQRLRAVAENLPGGAAFVVDHSLRYQVAGGEVLARAGMQPEDFLGRTVREAVGPEEAALHEPEYRKALAGETFATEHERHGRHFLTRGAPLRDSEGRVAAAMAVSYDITDRKRAEEALRGSEHQLRTLADAVPQIIWTNTGDGTANYFNRRWYEYSGLNFEESAGLGWQAIVHPEDAPRAVPAWQQALAGGEVFDTEYRLRGGDGAYRWFIGRNVPMRNAEGRVTGWFGTATDIQERKVSEAAMRASEEQFRRAIEDAPIPVIMHAEDGQVLQISKTWTKVTGYALEEMASLDAWLNPSCGTGRG